MGVYLSRPRTAKESKHGLGSLTRYGVTAMQGWRQHMEDAHIADPQFLASAAPEQKGAAAALSEELLGMQVYGVFDGHGGAAVAGWVAETLGPYLKEELSRVREDAASGTFASANPDLPDWLAQCCEALRRVFVRLDDEMVRPQARQMMQRLTQKQTDKEAALAKEEEATQDPKLKTAAPTAFLQALLGGANGQRPMVRIVEQDGQKYYQLFPSSMEEEKGCVRRAEEEDEDRTMDEEEADDHHRLFASDDHHQQPDSAAAARGGTEHTAASASSGGKNGEDQPDDIRQTGAPQKNADSEEDDDDDDETPGAAGATAAKSDNRAAYGSLAEPIALSSEGSSTSTTTTTLEIDTNGPSLYDPEVANYPEVSGTTAIVATVIPGPPPVLVVANAGDSRAVLSRGGFAVPLSYDHKPDLPREKNRIVNAGGKVTHGRIDGNLNLSRTVGDLSFKGNKEIPVEGQKISVVPDVSLTVIQPEDEFVIIACDGIWDCLSNQAAVDLIASKIHDSPDRDSDGCLPPEALARICEDICDQCLSKDPMKSDGGIGCDNMTLMVVQLNPALLQRAAEVDRRKVLPMPLSDGATIFYGEGPDFDAAAAAVAAAAEEDEDNDEESSSCPTAVAV